MNQKTQKIINDNLRKYFDKTSRITVISPGDQSNGFKINTGNTLQHELKKCEAVYELVKQGRSVVVEGKLLTGKRPDITIVDLENPMAYEIMHSEDMKSILQKSKRENYMGLKIMIVDSSEDIQGKL